MLISACVVGSVALSKQILKGFDKGILRIGAVLEQDLKTGRAPLDLWEN